MLLHVVLHFFTPWCCPEPTDSPVSRTVRGHLASQPHASLSQPHHPSQTRGPAHPAFRALDLSLPLALLPGPVPGQTCPCLSFPTCKIGAMIVSTS